MGIVDYLTSSPEYGTAIVIVPCAVDPARLVALLLLLLLLLQEYQEYHHRRRALSFPPSLSHTSAQLSCSLPLERHRQTSIILTTADKAIFIVFID